LSPHDAIRVLLRKLHCFFVLHEFQAAETRNTAQLLARINSRCRRCGVAYMSVYGR
jgi:hypothetical protein